MNQVQFQTPELQADGSFRQCEYQFKGDEVKGWTITRNGDLSLKLGAGYTLVKTHCCGVCSTDLARHFLPYPLPQVIGHEVVGRIEEKMVVVEINASHQARGVSEEDCPFCKNGMNTQCPERITLGINQLPGGFSPYFLAPVKAMQVVPESLSPQVASFTEPFAAALQGVEATFPKNGDSVAVLGPRRLGMLVIAALAGFRKREGLDFQITGIVRHSKLKEQCLQMGADEVLLVEKDSLEAHKQQFDIVFDTTGKVEGFEAALELSRRVVHLKSTNGQQVLGLSHLTDMVVDEIALLPFTHEHLAYSWPIEETPRQNLNILVSPTVSEADLEQAQVHHPKAKFHRMSALEAKRQIQEDPEGTNFLKDAMFPRFDLAIVSSLEEIDQTLRPVPGEEFSPVRPRGAILLASSESSSSESALSKAIRERQMEIHSSRCGNFERALEILANNLEIAHHMESNLITHTFPLSEVQNAFSVASDSEQSIKVLIEAS